MKLTLSLDVLLLLLLVPAHVLLNWWGGYLLVLLLLIYVALEIWHPLVAYETVPAHFDRTKVAFLLRFAILLLITIISPIAPTIQNISDRLQADAGHFDFTSAYERLHDGAYQTEVAVEHLAAGRNPYNQDYSDTLLIHYSLPEMDTNPAVAHYVYLPGLLLLSLPFRQAITPLLGYYDQRLLNLLAYAVVVLLLPLLAQRPERKLSLLAAIGLNPLLLDPISIGMNDVIVIAFLLIATLLLRRRRFFWSALNFALACTVKQSIWLIAPFYLMAVALMAPERRFSQLVRSALVLAVVVAVVIGPFMAWDFSSFWDDTFAYASGTATELNYPIRGYTLGRLLLIAGVIDSAVAYFPFWIFQLVFGVPLLLGSLRYQWRHRGLAHMFISAGFFVWTLGFLSRFFQGNYVGFVITLLLLGILLEPEGPEAASPVATMPPSH